MRILFYSGELSPYRLARYYALHKRRKHEIIVAEVPVEGHGFDETARRLYPAPVYEGETPSCEWSCEHIGRGDFDVVFVHGYWHSESRIVAKAARRSGVPVVLDLENSIYDKSRNWLKESLKRIWLRRNIDYAFVPGERAAEYAASLGFPRSRIWHGLFATDVDFYSRKAAEYRQSISQTRERLDLPERYFLFCGWLRPEKNVLRLVEAYSAYRKEAEQPWDLVILGIGEQEAAIRAKNVPGIRLRGFVQLDDLCAYYAAASCFVLVSVYDPWPLVLLEALATGLPSVASWKCGNTVELIRDGWNGWLCEPYDSADIARCLLAANNDLGVAKTAEQAGWRLVAPYSAEAWAGKVEYFLDRLIKPGKGAARG